LKQAGENLTDEPRTLYAIAESCPLDSYLVMEMKRSVSSLLQLNVKRFRVPQAEKTRYSALDVMKQALELLFEFSPSEKNYREAMRTIQVYSERDEEMIRILRVSFSLIANAVYNAFSGQKQTTALSPSILFLQGIPIERSDLEQAFRFVGVRPPELAPGSVGKTVFLDVAFDPYTRFLSGEMTLEQAENGRELHWAGIIEKTLAEVSGKALVRVGIEHVDQLGILSRLRRSNTGRLASILKENGIRLEIVHRIEDINRAFGKK
jgi:hypothetical protein